jgi:hypothetical protein
MTAPHDPARPGHLTRRDLAVLIPLLLVGIGGAGLATRQLATLSQEAENDRRVRAREITRLREHNAQLRQRALDRPTTSATTSPPANARAEAAIATTRDERMAALFAWAKLMSRGAGALMLRAQSESSSARRMAGYPDSGGPAYLVVRNQLPRDFGALFELRDDDVTVLQRALDTAQSRIDALTAASTQIRADDNGSFTLEVQGLDESLIAATRDTLLTTFTRVLGDDGYRAFLLLNGEMTDEEGRTHGGPRAFFNSFGTVGRTATISKTPEGRYRYEMQYGENGRASGGAATLEDLKERIGGGVRLLPPSF